MKCETIKVVLEALKEALTYPFIIMDAKISCIEKLVWKKLVGLIIVLSK